jgi:hypothetical protein
MYRRLSGLPSFADRKVCATAGFFGVEFVALCIVGVGGWLGGELVDRLGVGVDSDANLNATNSIFARRSRPA